MTRHGWRVIRVTRVAVLAAWLCAMVAPGVRAFTTSDGTAGYLVFPKILVEPPPGDLNGVRTDTLIQLSNVSDAGLRYVHCFYVDGRSCEYRANFSIELTRGQPTAWRVSEGLDAGATKIPPVGESFQGELKCVEVTNPQTLTAAVAQDLKGEATILRVSPGTPGSVDASSYNAIGFRPVAGTQSEPPAAFPLKCISGNVGAVCTTPGDDAACTKDGKAGSCASVLCLGQTDGSPECAVATHDACPRTVILNNFFDDAVDPVAQVPITTRVTFVPCTESLPPGLAAEPRNTLIQFLVFNEFEQRMSAGTRLQCYKDVQLSRIDSQPGYEKSSIFNVNVQGTLAGQTRMAAVSGTETNIGRGFVALAEEFHGSAAAAFNLNEQAISSKGDFVRYQAVLE